MTLIPAMARAQPAQDHAVAIALVMPDGRCLRRLASPATLVEAQAGFARAADDGVALMGRIAADAAASRFAVARERVPVFSAWAFDWVQSYVNSFRMLGAMLRGVADSATDGEILAGESLLQRMAVPMRMAFHQRVLAPAGLHDGLAADAAHAAGMLEMFWSRGLAEAARPILESGPPRGTPPGARLDLAAAVRGLAAEVTAGARAAGLPGGAEPGSDPTSILVHSMRPMAARLSAVALRATEAGSLLAAGGAFGFAMGGGAGLAVGTAGSVGLYWAIDWGLNRVDAALNRADFDAKAMQAIERAEAGYVDALDAAARSVLAARRHAITASAPGCPPPGAQ